MMTVHEVADYLRVKERKIYDLINQKQIPCTRVTGKWLFPRYLIDMWLMQNSESVSQDALLRSAPEIVVGSHDPLLEWALRESGRPIAMQTTGSMEGLSRFASGEALICGMHVLDTASGEFNTPAIKNALPDHGVVAIEWAWRQQGLIVAPGNPLELHSLEDIAEKKALLIDRQSGAGSRILLDHLFEKAGVDKSLIKIADKPARTEIDVGLTISNGKADVGIAVESVARQLRLDFIPLTKERFDLVMRRFDYFEPPIQNLLELTRSPAFIEKAEELGGYDLSGAGKVVLNLR
ncbi:helix-turn-helix domain-containing protein [Methylotuvimicrobium buryatense]|uniref:Helix-turn-helix domain-containing protein n=2 Tax=Methylotuvimicrobium buryatense TaxID=95641 RepID=A0A4P9UIV1_METBY|nr:helix-turn-helix transcriptional regulator [Methylotuvimicrobium buryatense]QCW81069.1 helix-turn-helix domain-containing protein [Methylotuvimicrobium buryatense]